MINVFTLTNINTKIIEGKFSKILFQKCVSNWLPFALIDRQEVARSFKQVGDPWSIAFPIANLLSLDELHIAVASRSVPQTINMQSDNVAEEFITSDSNSMDSLIPKMQSASPDIQQ